jgi:hypothetical protein
MTEIDRAASSLEKELDDLLRTAKDQPGVSELLEIIDGVNATMTGYAVEFQEVRFVGSTSTGGA